MNYESSQYTMDNSEPAIIIPWDTAMTRAAPTSWKRSDMFRLRIEGRTVTGKEVELLVSKGNTLAFKYLALQAVGKSVPCFLRSYFHNKLL